MAEAHRDCGALVIDSGFRLGSLTLKMAFLLVFPGLAEPPSTIIIYR